MKRRRAVRTALYACVLALLTACGGDDGSDQSDADLGSDSLQAEYIAPGSKAAFTGLTSSSNALQLSLTGLAEDHSIEIGGASTDGGPTNTVDLMTLKSPLQIVPDPSLQSGGLMISHSSKEDETFDTFTDFVSALSSDMTPTATVSDVAGTGSYDSSSTTFTAKTLAILIND
ncbi:MAG TPA: hypothetical protein VI653_17370 [Steroidobacteraceae bacterium]